MFCPEIMVISMVRACCLASISMRIFAYCR
jgi:hypothetical protein